MPTWDVVVRRSACGRKTIRVYGETWEKAHAAALLEARKHTFAETGAPSYFVEGVVELKEKQQFDLMPVAAWRVDFVTTIFSHPRTPESVILISSRHLPVAKVGEAAIQWLLMYLRVNKIKQRKGWGARTSDVRPIDLTKAFGDVAYVAHVEEM